MSDDTSTTPTTDTGLRSGDVVDSMTGYDEAAVEARFGKTIEALADHSGAGFLRALAWVHLRQSVPDGLDQVKHDVATFKHVQGMPFRDLKAMFKADDDDDAALPGAPAGNGDGQP